jgi:hypothetical protein
VCGRGHTLAKFGIAGGRRLRRGRACRRGYQPDSSPIHPSTPLAQISSDGKRAHNTASKVEEVRGMSWRWPELTPLVCASAVEEFEDPRHASARFHSVRDQQLGALHQ